ncbi:MAG: hypothetical protein ACRDKW_14000 [Actinomycetota bacterium]
MAADPPARPAMLGAVEESHDAVVAIADGREAWLYLTRDGALQDRGRLVEGLLDRRKRAAWHGEGERTLRNRKRTLVRTHPRATAELAEELLQEEGAELLVLGGPREMLRELVEHVTQPVRPAGRDVRDRHVPRRRARSSRRRRACSTTTSGSRRWRWSRTPWSGWPPAAWERQVSTGACWPSMSTRWRCCWSRPRPRRPGRVCDTCGWLGLDGTECPVDGRPTRPTSDVLDDTARRVALTCGHVENVGPGTPLHDHEVAAILRFPVLPPLRA